MLLFDALLTALGAILPLLIAAILLALLVSFGPRAITAWRQRAYDAAVADETVRLELTAIGGGVIDPERPLALIRALHTGERRGAGRWGLGWPTVELRSAWRKGRLVWQIDCPRQLMAGLQTTVRPLYPGLDLRVVDRDDPPATATAIGSLTAPAHWPLGEADLPENRSLHRLAGALEHLPTGLEATLRLTARPISATAWRQLVTPSPEAGGRSMGSFLGAALMEGLQVWRSADQPAAATPVTLSRDEREAYAGKAKNSLGFEVRMRLELAGARHDVAQAELWKLVEFTQPLTNGSQRIHWEPRPGVVSKAPSVKLADFELAQLWYLPDASFDRLDLPRERPLVERREPDEAQLVTSEFVELFEDLWPKFCGPKMQHYLRQALLTLLSHPEPQTVIELVRVLTDDSLRDEYLDHVDDPMLSAFWRTEWPGPRERDRDTSIKAVLNKLGAFVSYGSIRQVVGQGVSTLRPRQVMDDGDLLVVDLSR
ncbi:MAG: hypothetical protein ACRDG7_19470, partial [Candidatus Limnocylindria bacterium]